MSDQTGCYRAFLMINEVKTQGSDQRKDELGLDDLDGVETVALLSKHIQQHIRDCIPDADKTGSIV